MLPSLSYDIDADAIYVRLRDLPYAYGEDLDHERRIDYAVDGLPIGVELLCVSEGVNLDNLPDRASLARLLEVQHVKVFA